MYQKQFRELPGCCVDRDVCGAALEVRPPSHSVAVAVACSRKAELALVLELELVGFKTRIDQIRGNSNQTGFSPAWQGDSGIGLLPSLVKKRGSKVPGSLEMQMECR